MRKTADILTTAKAAGALLAALALTACGPNPGGPAAAPDKPAQPATPAAEYATATQHFIALQQAGLTADYDGFVRHLAEADRAAVKSALAATFAGQSFDSYTARAQGSATAYKRLVELRGTGGRLYLYVELQKVPGGWAVAGTEIGRDRRAMVTRL